MKSKMRRLCCGLLCLAVLGWGAGCNKATQPSERVEETKPLSPSYGIANQAYLYGMDYILSERWSSPSFDVEKEVRLMANLGVRSIRLWLHQTYLLYDPETVNETRAATAHKVMAECARYGIEVVGMSHTSFHNGTYASGEPARDVTTADSYYVGWLKDYYTAWKTLATEFKEVSTWEIDNEMNNGDFMCDTNGNKVYSLQEMADIAADMLYYGSRGIHEANPAAKTVLGGITEPMGLGSGQNKTFLQNLYDDIKSGNFGYFYFEEEASAASKNADDYFQVACWHPYMTSAFVREDFVRFNNEIYDVILQNEGKHKTVLFTEMGFSDARQSEETGATYIKEMFKAIEEEMPYVQSVHYFRLFNVATSTWTGTVSRFGLFYDPDVNRIDYDQNDANKRFPAGAPKAKAYAFQEAAGGEGSLRIMETVLD